MPDVLTPTLVHTGRHLNVYVGPKGEIFVENPRAGNMLCIEDIAEGLIVFNPDPFSVEDDALVCAVTNDGNPAVQLVRSQR